MCFGRTHKGVQMAHFEPKSKARRCAMRNLWRVLRFLFGTPRRALVTVGVATICAVIQHVWPGFLGCMLYKLLMGVVGPVVNAVLGILNKILGPLAWALAPLVIVGFGFRILLKGFRKR